MFGRKHTCIITFVRLTTDCHVPSFFRVMYAAFVASVILIKPSAGLSTVFAPYLWLTELSAVDLDVFFFISGAEAILIA